MDAVCIFVSEILHVIGSIVLGELLKYPRNEL